MRAPFVVLAALLAACGSGGDAPVLVTVVITYDAPTAPDGNAQQQAPACFAASSPTHLHPSWRDFATVPLVANGPSQWTLTFSDVPAGVRVAFRVNDPNRCPSHPTGAVTTDIRANGVLLTDVVATPGSGPEPGLAFTVDGSGAVTP